MDESAGERNDQMARKPGGNGNGGSSYNDEVACRHEDESG